MIQQNVIGKRMEAISVMELVGMGVKVLVNFRNIALMIASMLESAHLRPCSNIDSFLLIDVCRKFERKLRRFIRAQGEVSLHMRALK